MTDYEPGRTHHHPELARREFWAAVGRWLTIGILVLTAGVLIVENTITTTAIRHSQVDRAHVIDQGTEAAKAAQSGVDILNDCLTPGGECYERSQQNQARILEVVKAQTIYIALCVRDPGTSHNPAALTACVDDMAKEFGYGIGD